MPTPVTPGTWIYIRSLGPPSLMRFCQEIPDDVKGDERSKLASVTESKMQLPDWGSPPNPQERDGDKQGSPAAFTPPTPSLAVGWTALLQAWVWDLLSFSGSGMRATRGWPGISGSKYQQFCMWCREIRSSDFGKFFFCNGLGVGGGLRIQRWFLPRDSTCSVVS